MIRQGVSATWTGGRQRGSWQRLAFEPAPPFELRCDDPATLEWILEFYGPALTETATAGAAEFTITASAERHAELRSLVSAGAAEWPCFAFDQELFTLPAAAVGGAVAFVDDERSCALRIAATSAELAGEPGIRRWRLIALLVIHELIATPLRAAELELHAAAVEHDGRALLIAGPKGAGKTTLSFHLLRSRRCRQIANDRVFAAAGAIRGIPQAIKILPETAAEFAELTAGRWIERAHLHTVSELERLGSDGVPLGATLMLNPAQLAARFDIETIASAPPGALLFPRVDTGAPGPVVTRLSADEARAGLRANLYGGTQGERGPTVFEELAGGRAPPPLAIADRLAESVPAYRVRLDERARENPAFGDELLGELSA